jgi:hypothetical protein
MSLEEPLDVVNRMRKPLDAVGLAAALPEGVAVGDEPDVVLAGVEHAARSTRSANAMEWNLTRLFRLRGF